MKTLRRHTWFDELRQDMAAAFRGLRRSPVFTAVALLTLGLGIGANTSVFGVLRSILLRPLPYPEAERLVQVWTDHRHLGRAEPEWFAPPEFAAYRDDNSTFSQLAAFSGWGPNLTEAGVPEALVGAVVTADFFRVFDTPPVLGRDFTAADDDPAAEPVVIISDGLWRRRFGADPDILGRAIYLNGEPWTVVGVQSPTFRAPFPWEVWRPIRRPATSGCDHACYTLRAYGRLAPGVSLAAAHADLSRVAIRLEQDLPEVYRGVRPWLIPLHQQVTGPVRPALLALLGAVGFVLLIACVNLAGLLLVRAGARSREFSIRAALGAGRRRIARQLLTESLVLAGLGGLLGLALGWGGTRLLAGMVPAGILLVQEIRLDLSLVLFTAALTTVAGVLFGLLPAWHAARSDLVGVLRTGSPEGGRRIGVVRNGLVVFELAVAVVLLVGAGLLLRSFVALQRTDLGFRTEGMVTAGVLFPAARYPDIQQAAVGLADLLERLGQHRAVRRVEATDLPPLAGGGDQDMTVFPDGRGLAAGERPPGVWYRRVSGGYMELMEYSPVRGRLLTQEDRQGGEQVAVINTEAARTFWPGGENPVGRILATGLEPTSTRVRVVGVVATGRPDGPTEPVKPEIFLPVTQFRVRGVTLVVEPAADAAAAVSAVREALAQVDPELPLGAVSSFSDRLAEATALSRYLTTTVGGFAAAALLLALVGVYGVTAYALGLREREIGVRMALGAAPAEVVRLLLGQGVRLAVAGIALGLLAAIGATRALRALLYGVEPLDPSTFVAVGVVLGGAALGACWLPARRARRVNPIESLRTD